MAVSKSCRVFCLTLIASIGLSTFVGLYVAVFLPLLELKLENASECKIGGILFDAPDPCGLNLFSVTVRDAAGSQFTGIACTSEHARNGACSFW